MASHTSRTMDKLRELGYLPAVVEKWNPHARIRQDLYGFIDVLAIQSEHTLAVQACAYCDISKRIAKIEDSDHVGTVRDANWSIEVWGWRKVKNRWQVKRVNLS